MDTCLKVPLDLLQKKKQLLIDKGDNAYPILSSCIYPSVSCTITILASAHTFFPHSAYSH